jgi:hypothetical protein
MMATAPNRVSPFPSATATSEMIEPLQALVRRNRRRWKTILVLEAIGWAVALPLAYLWLVFFLDAQFHLPMVVRVLFCLGGLAGLGLAVRHLVHQWRMLQLTEDEVALAIERRTPGKVQNRLINAVQLARSSPTEARDLSDAVIQENYDRLRQIHLEQAAQLRPALLRVGLAGAMIVVGIVFWLVLPAQFVNAASRIFLPLARIDPIYRTRLDVDPGDIEAAGDVTIHVTIHGERPATLTVLKRMQGKLSSETVAVDQDGDSVDFTFREVNRDFVYAVRGGDFTSPYFQVTVPRKTSLARLRATLHYPDYTNLGEKTIENTTGELEAVQGTKAEVRFVLDRPADEVKLILDRPAGAKAKTEPQVLEGQAEGKEFVGEFALEQVVAYRLELGQVGRATERLGPFAIHVIKDQEPKLELLGLDRRSEVEIDSVLPLQIKATDDFGLEKVGLFFRKAAVGQELARRDEAGWQAIATWPGEKKTSLTANHELAFAKLQVAEGDRIELALRAIDTEPGRRETWTTGAVHELAIGGDGVALQRQYEQILRGASDLKGVFEAEQALLAKVVDWLKKLDGAGDLRWDDPKNIESLHKAVTQLAADQQSIRKSAGEAAQGMLIQTGNTRIAVGLLADTEMVRVQRILEAVEVREQPSGKRSALADARLTQERILHSLQELQEQYASFRQDWELSNMVPFVKMLADRQTRMRDQSRRFAESARTEKYQQLSMSGRQTKLIDLCKLIQPAFVGLAERVKDQDAMLAKAFGQASATLAGDSLRNPMREAQEDAGNGRWSDVAGKQTAAAAILTDLHAQLHQAQLEAAKRALAALKEKAKTDLEAQKELDRLKAGTGDAAVKNYPENFKVEDTVRIWEVTGKKNPGDAKETDPDFKNAPLVDYDKAQIELSKDSGVRQDTNALRLGSIPEKTSVMPLPREKERNKVEPFIQEKFDDLVGKLLEEADELHKDFQTYSLSTNQNNNDPGDIGKLGGSLNSTGAVAATGNKKPPTADIGGVSRTGRQGARAHGMVADDDGFNRRGRDKAQEGEMQVPDQAGKNKMHKTEDEQKDTSTGVGGKKIDSDDAHFSIHDAGKWKDEFTKRMEKPKNKEFIVERQGDKIDARTAAELRDLTSKQEQVIERLKSIKKELKNLYLPTEHLDEMAAALQTNLESLKERPDADLFRLQAQALEKLRGAMRVFQSASTSFQPSLPRERAIRDRILDEPDRPALPGYEDAVREYYLKLSGK